MVNGKLCIICNTRKPDSHFEKKGEHIVPRFLGNRKLRTPHVCKTCNGGLGGTVDVALKNVPEVKFACFDRGIGGTNTGENTVNGIVDKSKLTAPRKQPPENPDVKGAILKIVYETAHLRLGNNWLHDPAAAAIRDVLSAYVRKDRAEAHKLMNDIEICYTDTAVFYYTLGKSRGELLKRAVSVKSCLNGLWLLPIKDGGGCRLAVAVDIEGMPFGYIAVSGDICDICEPELIAPTLK